MTVLAVDPGRDKIGLALLDGGGRVISRTVAPADALAAALEDLAAVRRPDVVVVGAGTASCEAVDLLEAVLDEVELVRVDEAGSTLEARELWADEFCGPLLLLPRFVRLLLAPGVVDDLAAVVLGRRWLAGRAALSRLEGRSSGGVV